jgi:lysophospholipid acyltransferase (LPLAT)-like uncharacterized protein
VTLRILGVLAAIFVRTLHLTLRVRHVNVDAALRTPRHIFAFWHEHLLLMLQSKFQYPITVLSSSSKDGDIAVWAYRTYGVDTIRGSSTRGAQSAMRGVIRRARGGSNLAFTPDGPKGPPHVVKEGVIFAAQMTELPIVPVAFGAAKFKRLRSWDRMIVPKPFSRAVFLYGEPIVVARDANVDEATRNLEDTLNRLAKRVDEEFEAVWQEGKTR